MRHLQVQNSQSLLEKLNFIFKSISSLSIAYFFTQNARKSEFINFKPANFAAILFIYVCSRSERATIVHVLHYGYIAFV